MGAVAPVHVFPGGGGGRVRALEDLDLRQLWVQISGVIIVMCLNSLLKHLYQSDVTEYCI